MAARYTFDGKEVKAKLPNINIAIKGEYIELVTERVDVAESETMQKVVLRITDDAFLDLLQRVGPTIKAEAWATVEKFDHLKRELLGAKPDDDISGISLTIS